MGIQRVGCTNPVRLCDLGDFQRDRICAPHRRQCRATGSACTRKEGGVVFAPACQLLATWPRRRAEPPVSAPTPSVALCGNYDARILAHETPEPMSETKGASLLGLVGLIDGAC